MAANDVPIPLQTDTLSQIPGGGVRAITAIIMLNGVPTAVSMQVISLADANGAVLQDLGQLSSPFDNVVAELRDIKRLLAVIAQVPFLESDVPVDPTSNPVS